MRKWISLGHSVLFVTFTMPHDFGEPIDELICTLKVAKTRVMSGRPFRRDREEFGIAHSFWTFDVTHGENGWHPHWHAALFVEGDQTPEQLEEMKKRLYNRYAEAVEERGHRRPTRENGIHLEKARDVEGLSRYLLKVRGEDSGATLALELTRGDLKTGKGRTPFQILRDFLDSGDTRDLALFHEYEKATKGQHFARWSNGAKSALGIEDLSDQDLVEEEVGGETLYTFTPEEFHALSRTPGAMAEGLRVAEREGGEGVRKLLQFLVPRWKARRRAKWIREQSRTGREAA